MQAIYLVFLIFLIGSARSSKIVYDYNSCILATIDASANIPGVQKALINSDGSSGECGSNTTSLKINFEQNATLTVSLDLRDGYSYLSTLQFNYLNGSNSHVASLDGIDEQISSESQWYACDEPKVYTLSGDNGKVTITFESIKIQPFGVVNGTYSDDKTSCTASNNSTSTATPNTTPKPTTQKPTTPKPTTPKPTTPKPTPTSTSKPTTGGPTTPKPTTKVPPVTQSPNAVSINASVADSNGNVCLLIKFTGTLDVVYLNKTDKNDTYHYAISRTKSTTGKCGNDTQDVTIVLLNDWKLTFTFSKNQAKKATRRLLAETYAMDKVRLDYNTKDIPNAKTKAAMFAVSEIADRNKATIGQSFRCNAAEKISMNGATLDTTDFQAEAFRSSNTTAFTGTPLICNADETQTSDVVPIVVGVVLALLVLVIIIAYLIGRRRNQPGYQSV